MLHKLRQRASDEKGFTLIELLVVILIIGILAAIALPAFLGQKGRAQDTEAKTAARTAQTAIETYYVDNQKYTGADAAKLRTIEPALNEGAAKGSGLALSNIDVNTYTVTVTATGTNNTFSVTKAADGSVTRTCVAKSLKGGCPASAVDGSASW